MSLTLVYYDDPVLREKGEKIGRFDASLRQLAAEMVTTMHAADGIGLAAQQIGRAIRLCVIDLRGTDREFSWELDGTSPPLDLIMPMVLANPEILSSGEAATVYEEGCLSFPEIRGDVVRPDAIRLRYQDEHGLPHELACDGLLSRCIQHEVDHLNGVLFIDRMSRRTLAGLEPSLKQLARATRDGGQRSAKR